VLGNNILCNTEQFSARLKYCTYLCAGGDLFSVFFAVGLDLLQQRKYCELFRYSK